MPRSVALPSAAIDRTKRSPNGPPRSDGVVAAMASVGGGVTWLVGPGSGSGGAVTVKATSSSRLPIDGLPDAADTARKANLVHVCPAGTT